ncbi:MAG TPA: AMP-binding protein [Steroidobacteraceae bacterium]|jgi:acyl-CoA synthetase (AMP-forming)/AMP-acid ligase II|nr:AMP-binding protein [Steroidobacteraceae bacterium]
MNSFAFLDKAARQYPDRAAIVHGDVVWTYKQFRERALAIGGNLRALDCKPGDRIAFCLANSPAILELIYGCFAAGLVVVPINARLHVREIAYIVQNSDARALIFGSEYQESIAANSAEFAGLNLRICMSRAEGALPYSALLEPQESLSTSADVSPDAICWLFYTSGTTGRPKGAIWNHRMVRVVVMNYLADVYNIQPGETVLHAAPMSHGSGIVALPAVARGATNVISPSPSFDPKALFSTIQNYKVSHIAFLAPTQIIKMLEAFTPNEFDLSSLKAICYGGAPLYVEHLRNAIDTFGPVFTQVYGQGEAPITITGLNRNMLVALLKADDPRIGSAGQIRTDVEAMCVGENDAPLGPNEVGEVVVRGDVVMPGYWKDPVATEEALRAGWLHTGDVGYFDDQGFLFLLDRAKDMIISGGNNVYPREVEEVIIQHPGVASVVVLGVPHAYWGEAVHAVIVAKAGVSLTAEEVIAHCGRHIAGYKKPKSIDFVDTLPVSGYGKIMRREVRERYWQGLSSRIGGGQVSRQDGIQ